MGKTVNCSIQDELESSLLQIENVGLPGEVCVLAFSQLEEVSLFYQLFDMLAPFLLIVISNLSLNCLLHFKDGVIPLSFPSLTFRDVARNCGLLKSLVVDLLGPNSGGSLPCPGRLTLHSTVKDMIKGEIS